MKKLFTLVCLAALLGVIGCAPASTTPAPTEPPASEGETSPSEEPATDAGAANDERPPAGRFVQADPKLATLKAKFVYDGTPPARAKVDSSKDPFCAPIEILSEAMLVGKDGALQNLVLMLDSKRTKAEIPAEYKKPVDGKVELDNNGCVFKPHIVFARVGQTIEVLNSDQTGHNANFGFFNNEAENFLIPAKDKRQTKKLVAEESTMMPVECNIHPWMKAYVVVLEHPYAAASDEHGQIEIHNLPVGDVTFLVRHENADGAIDEGKVDGKTEKWGRGRMELTLKAGMNDLGTITIAADKFKK